ncbi:DUF1027 domain-containing protein, partial [Staphylococcus aureus]
KKAEISKRFSSIQDYILEYCNFGCPYFVLRHLSNKEVQQLNHALMKNYLHRDIQIY